MKLLLLILVLLFTGCSELVSSDEPLTSDKSSGELITEGSKNGQGSSQSGVITAGEWSDLENWSFFLNLLSNQSYAEYAPFWHYRSLCRVTAVVTVPEGSPAVNEPVTLRKNGQEVWTAKTNSRGYAELWAPTGETEFSQYSIETQGEKLTGVLPFTAGVNRVTVSKTSAENSADIAFVIDATGSMGDELEFLKRDLVSVISQVKTEHSGTVLRTSAVVYRDNGDEYITRRSDFSEQSAETAKFIQNQYASGGGDWPEAVHTALSEAVNQLTWRSTARSRILFLLMDAPPHSDQQIISSAFEAVKSASQKGIVIIPVVSSGIDKSTEFLMRFAAASTNGTYVFITDHSGVGGDHLEPTVGQYEVEKLNACMVRLISESLKP